MAIIVEAEVLKENPMWKIEKIKNNVSQKFPEMYPTNEKILPGKLS